MVAAATGHAIQECVGRDGGVVTYADSSHPESGAPGERTAKSARSAKRGRDRHLLGALGALGGSFVELRTESPGSRRRAGEGTAKGAKSAKRG